MGQHASLYFSLFVSIVVIHLCCLNEVNCDEDHLRLWYVIKSRAITSNEPTMSQFFCLLSRTLERLNGRKAVEAIHMAESSVSSEDGDAKVTRPLYSTKPSSYFWDNRIIREKRKKRSTISSESLPSESKVETDTEKENDIEKYKETSEDSEIVTENIVLKSEKIHKEKSTAEESSRDTQEETVKVKHNSEIVTENIVLRSEKIHKSKSTTEESKYITDTQEETVKVKHSSKLGTHKTKHTKANPISTKRESKKTTKTDMVKTLETHMENSTETEETEERLKALNEMGNVLESEKKLTTEDNFIRQKYDLNKKNKEHSTTKLYNHDRTRDRWLEEKKSTKKSQQLEDKEKVKRVLEKGRKKKTHSKLKHEHTTTKKEDLRSQTRLSKNREITTEDALRKSKKKYRKHSKIDEPRMDVLDPYSLTKQLKKILCKLEDTNVTLTTIGRTAAYNDIVLLQATEYEHDILRSGKTRTLYADDPPEKKIIFIVHGLNIWSFTSIPRLYLIDSFLLLLKNYLEHLDKFDIYLIPMANPDGVAFSLHHPVWNKNMSPQDACPGVMLDRNFDVAWNEGPQLSSCSQHYPGNHPFSEHETQAIREVFRRLSHKIVAYIHVHGGGFNGQVFKGDAVLYPKGFTDLVGDEDKYIDLKGEIDEAMRNASFKVLSVTVDSLYNWYGKVSGTSVDYASTVYGIPFALDFSMQLYTLGKEDSSDLDYDGAAQNEIWHRLIDVIFRYIYKSAVKKETTPDLRKYKNIV